MFCLFAYTHTRCSSTTAVNSGTDSVVDDHIPTGWHENSPMSRRRHSTSRVWQ